MQLTITTSEHFCNGVKKIYANAEGFGTARLEDVYNNDMSQEDNHVKVANETKKIFGFSKIDRTEKVNDSSFIHYCI